MARFSMSVSDYMSTPALTVGVVTPLDGAAALMRDHDVSSLAVVAADGRVNGILTFTDLLRVGTRRRDEQGANLLTFPDHGTVSDAMSMEVEMLDAALSCAEAASVMVRKRYHRLLVTREGDLVGVLSPFDLMRLLVHEGLDTPISELMSSPLLTVNVDATIAEATAELERAKVSSLVVLEGEWLVGLFAQREALESRAYSKETSVESVMTPAFAALECGTPVRRAAANAIALGARRVVAMDEGRPVGILSGLDFARAVAEA